MRRSGSRFALGALCTALAAGSCRAKPDSTVTLPVEDAAGVSRGEEPPVALDPEPGVEYPVDLYQLRISGTVLLRLFADETGKLIPDSTRVEESSGYPALDSAALAAVSKLHYAPARRNGIAVASAFTQPIRFRHPDRGGTTP